MSRSGGQKKIRLLTAKKENCWREKNKQAQWTTQSTETNDQTKPRDQILVLTKSSCLCDCEAQLDSTQKERKEVKIIIIIMSAPFCVCSLASTKTTFFCNATEIRVMCSCHQFYGKKKKKIWWCGSTVRFNNLLVSQLEQKKNIIHSLVT